MVSAMKHKSTILLLAAVAIAGVVAYSLSHKPTSEELSQQRRRVLKDFKAGDITSLTIEKEGKRLVCRREDGGDWRIAEPVGVRADRYEVQDILDAFAAADMISSPAFPKPGQTLDMSVYALDKPARKVTMSEGNPPARSWTVLIGKETGVADSVFVAVEGQEGVCAVKKNVADKTDVTLTGLRSKYLAERISLLDLERIQVQAAAADGRDAFDLACARAEDRWEMKEPVHELADAQAVRNLAGKLYDHRIGPGDFVVDDPTKAADYGLDKPLLTLSLEGNGKSQTIVLSRRPEAGQTQCYAMNKAEPAIVRVPESLFDALRKDPAELKDKSLAEFAPEGVKRIVIATHGAELVLDRGDGQWSIAGQTPAKADKQAIDDFLDALKGAKVQEFVAEEPGKPAPHGLSEDEAVTVTLSGSEDRALARLLFGAASDDGTSFYARRGSYPSVVRLKRERYYADARLGRLAFLSRLVLEEPTAQAVEMLIIRKGKRFQCVRQDSKADWLLAEPVQGKADRWAAESIVTDFSRLRVEGFAGEDADDLAPYGLAEPQVEVTVAYRPEAAGKGAQTPETTIRTRTVQVGAKSADPAGFYARLADEKRVFVLPDHVANHFQEELASKDICDVAEPTALTFRRGQEALRLAHDPQARKWKDAEGQELTGAQAEAVEGAARLLRDFRAVSVADYVEKGRAFYGFDEPYLLVEIEEEGTTGKRVVIGSETEQGNRYAKGPATGYVDVAAAADVAKLSAVFEPPAVPAAGD
jgi:hypothetical protein